MSRDKFQNLLQIASEQVPLGVYAVKKGDYAELKNNICKSKTQLRQMIKAYKQQGFKVYFNGL